MTATTPAKKALSALRRSLGGRNGLSAADWALTLHLLEKLAPAFFEQERLAPELAAALEAVRGLACEFPPGLDAREAMARVDAQYLRAVRGLAARSLHAPSLQAWVESNATREPLHAWMIAGLARQLGVEHPPVFRARYPFAKTATLAHRYLLTHELMLATGYFARAPQVELRPVLDELAAWLPGSIAEREWDLVAEIAFCLSAAGRAAPGAREALAAAQAPDGSMPGADEHERAHASAAAAIAFAAGATPPSSRRAGGRAVSARRRRTASAGKGAARGTARSLR